MAGSTCVIPEVKKRSKVGELSSEAESSSMACVAADASSKAGSVDGFADPDPIARECGGTDDCAAPQHQRTRGTRADMAACTLEEEEDCEMAAAHAYMTQFVRGRLSSGGSTASIFDEFGVPARFRPQSHPTLVEVCDLLLAWVTHCREQEDMSAALEGAEYVEFTPSFADCTGRFVDARVVSFSHA
uniref:Uncharacterized protein n=1 Tax=Chrysotila carterae TaxID=13221 RepID=A0A7S4B3M0_CHRCT